MYKYRSKVDDALRLRR